MRPPPDAPLHFAGCAHGEPATWDVKEFIGAGRRCTDCGASSVLLAAVLRGIALYAEDLVIRLAGLAAAAAQLVSVKLAAWAVETREAARRPLPPPPPCGATLREGGFQLVCHWAAHDGPDHMDYSRGVWRQQ